MFVICISTWLQRMSPAPLGPLSCAAGHQPDCSLTSMKMTEPLCSLSQVFHPLYSTHSLNDSRRDSGQDTSETAEHGHSLCAGEARFILKKPQLCHRFKSNPPPQATHVSLTLGPQDGAHRVKYSRELRRGIRLICAATVVELAA